MSFSSISMELSILKLTIAALISLVVTLISYVASMAMLRIRAITLRSRGESLIHEE